MVSPKTSFLDWDQTASNNTDVGGIGIQGTNAVSNFDDALRTIMAQLRAGVDGEVVYAAKAANYTALANDNNAYLRFTSAATLSLTAVATLGANWHIFVQADGADVIVDPNASETINGATTITIRNGESAIIISTGSAFFARINPAQIVYAAKSGNYTALPADNGAIHRYTATATVTLTAAATLGSSWSYTVVADGAAVTIDPNASETINGALTLVIPNGSSARIICDGSNFFTVFKPNVWETINRYTLAAATTLPMTGLAAYQVLKATVYIVNSANATVGFRVSIDNGASYISTANHLSQTLIGSGASAAAATSAAQTFAQVSANALATGSFTTVINNWNNTTVAPFHSTGYGADGSNQFSFANGAFSPATASARNALQLLLGSAGTMTGYVILEGIRA